MKKRREQHRETNSPEYATWRRMIRRCESSTTDNFPRYGGRGIVVCRRWRQSFLAFLADMGRRPPHCSIDRIDTNGNYEPGNCRWATTRQQNRNKRTARLTATDVATMRARHASGEAPRDIAPSFGVRASYVSRIVNGHIWKGEQ